MDLTTIFCHVDDFCKEYFAQVQKRALPDCGYNGNKRYLMTLSEVISVFVYYGSCSSELKTFKAFYKYTLGELKLAFPKLVSYSRMIELKEIVQTPLCMFLLTILGNCTGISFGDSTKIEACNIKRANNHKTLKTISAKGKIGSGWFYGLKLHLVLNHIGEIINLLIAPGNIADNDNQLIRKLTKKLFGKIFTDKGYIVNPILWQELYKRGLQMIYGIRSNMKQKFMPIEDKLLLRKRASVAEGAFSILKDRMSLQYTKHRSVYGFICHIVSMLIAYQLRPTKPSVKFLLPQDSKNYVNFFYNYFEMEKNALFTAC